MIYDIFYVSDDTINDDDWKQFRLRFPSAQKIENVKTFNDIKKKAFTKFFWVVWNDLTIVEDFAFDYRVPVWDEQYTHVWLNGSHYNGVCLFSKTSNISQREFDLRFFVNTKEIPVVASHYKDTVFDIIFISYNEPNAERNFTALQKRFPRVKRVQNITGIHQAHIAAAKISDTDMFWAVDGDAEIVEGFEFNFNDPEKFTVYVWSSQNPINNLIYGYGGVKLLPRKLTLDMNTESADMTTSISTKFKIMSEISNKTIFNTDPFSTWRSAFRECVKLSSKVIDRNYDSENDDRLLSWCVDGADSLFGNYAIGGARAGKRYGIENISDTAALQKINDFSWLELKFQEWLKTNG